MSEDAFFPGEADNVLERIGRAAQICPIPIEELVKGAEMLAVFSYCGIHPEQVFETIMQKYPHLKEDINILLTDFYAAAAGG